LKGSMATTEEKLRNLLELLKDIDLDFSWLVAAVSLSAQEIAIKRKLDELGESYGEEDFQILVDKLAKIMEERKMEVPHILLSIARSYRHIRAKVLHDPNKTKLSDEEAEAIFNNTKALFKTLFRKEIEAVGMQEFVNSITNSSLDQKIKEFGNFNETSKKQVFEAIMDKISLLDWTEIEAHKELFEFLKATLKAETNIALQSELFEIILRKTLLTTISSSGKEESLPIIAEFTKLSHIRELIRDKNLVSIILTEYETSSSFMIAGWNAEIILNLSPLLGDEGINRVVEAALSNDQITYSFSARASLKKFLSLYKNRISKEKAKKLEEVLKEKSPFI